MDPITIAYIGYKILKWITKESNDPEDPDTTSTTDDPSCDGGGGFDDMLDDIVDVVI